MSRCRGRFRAHGPLAVCGCLALAMAVGCRSTSRQAEPLDALAAGYDKAHLEYKIDAGKLNVPIELARIEGQAVSYDHQGSLPLPEQAIGTLTVDYPHPEKHIGFAKARLEIRSQDAAKLHAAETSSKRSWLWGTAWLRRKTTAPADEASTVVEVWEVDIPRAELDQALTQLNRQGYFVKDVDGRGGVELAIKIGPREASKRWQQVAQLDGLMLRARGQGRLVAYNRPHAPASAPPSAVLAYQQWQQPAAGAADVPQTMPVGPSPYAQQPTGAPYIAAVPQTPGGQTVIGTPVPRPAQPQVSAAYPAETPVPTTGGYAPGFAPAPAVAPALPYGTAAATTGVDQRRL